MDEKKQKQAPKDYNDSLAGKSAQFDDNDESIQYHHKTLIF